MKIVHLSQELAPFSVASAAAIGVSELISAQASAGDSVVVLAAMPQGDFIPPPFLARRLSPLVVETLDGTCDVTVMEGLLPGCRARLFLLGLPEGSPRTATFGLAAQTLLPTFTERPGLLHLHDDTGCDVDVLRLRLNGTTVVQSVYDAGLDSQSLAAALQDADAVVVPCSGLAEATSDSAVAALLRGQIQARVAVLGVDTVRWNPASDMTLVERFSPESLSGKARCRAALQRRAGLPPRPDTLILALWARQPFEFDSGAAVELLSEIRRLDIQLVSIEGAGVEGLDTIHAALREGGIGWVAPEWSEVALRTVLGGSDAVLLPDAVEPLGQRALISMRYGVVPVARMVQAHRDLLVEYDVASRTGGAFFFQTPDELLRALNRLEKAHRDLDGWSSMVRANALVDSGWSRPLSHLQEIYRKALAK